MKWAFEKEAVGYYLTGHPLEDYREELQRFAQVSTADLGEECSGEEVTLGGVIASVRRLTNRKGESMAILVLEDLVGTAEVLVWPNTFQKCKDLLTSDAPVLVIGRCETDSNGESRVLASAIRSFDSLWDEMVQKARITIPVARLDAKSITELARVFEKHPGQCLVEFELVHDECLIRLVPNQDVRISPNPSFVRAVENLFGGKSVTLYT
jgi:DNA polymerase-3 subunit alpha